jgi:glycosyltransferase involved in cell wall biosynthesis
VDPGDVPSLARAITRVLTEPEFAARLVDVGTERAEEYDLARTTQRVVEVYDSVAR